MLLPATLASLAAALASGWFEPADGIGYLPGSGEDDDAEEVELLATEAAAAASLRQLGAAGPEVSARRVVLAADLDDRVEPDVADVARGSDGAPLPVRLAAPVPISAVASVLVDPVSRIALVRAALAGETHDAYEAREQVEAGPLLWFDRSEIDVLIQGETAK